MKKQLFKVYSVDWRDDEPTDVFGWDAEDAALEWCNIMDGNSNFVDGYPERHELRIVAPYGTEKRFLVSTDWSPQFYASEKEETAA